jgi:hypothetical protein
MLVPQDLHVRDQLKILCLDLVHVHLQLHYFIRLLAHLMRELQKVLLHEAEFRHQAFKGCPPAWVLLLLLWDGLELCGSRSHLLVWMLLVSVLHNVHIEWLYVLLGHITLVFQVFSPILISLKGVGPRI